MSILIVVNDPSDWPLDTPAVKVVPAREYLTNPEYTEERAAKVFNLCRSYRYQSSGYYVSLLAAARGHKPIPSVNTLQDFKAREIVRVLSSDLDELIQRSLKPIQGESFTLSIYFGHNVAKRYSQLALHLFNLFQAPLLRAQFVRNDKWQLQSIRPIAANDIPEEHRDFALEVANEHFAGRVRRARKPAASRYDLAILHDPEAAEAPSNHRALQRFARAGAALGLAVDFITRDDYGRVAEYDALFIRETTMVDHHTYRFARRADAEGLVVIDDPDSILKCTNKVYQAESLGRHGVAIPKTVVVHRGNVVHIAAELGLPCVLKKPDSSFSLGVIKVDTAAELEEQVTRLLERSALLIAQEFLPTDFDWRVGVCDGQPLYVCKYMMAPKHWQIIARDESGKKAREGGFEAFPVEEAPRQVVHTAVKAAALMGDGLYGVDLKQVGRRCYVMEVNDNPNIDSGVEDEILKDELYAAIMRVFLRRIEARALRGRHS